MKIGDNTVLPDKRGRRRTHICVGCRTCNKLFYKEKRFVVKHGGIDSGRHFCNDKCYYITRRKSVETKCAYCHKTIIRTPSKIISTLHFCSREHKELAQTLEVGLLKCGHYGDGRTEYRTRALRHYGIKCELCSEAREPMLDVHHIDGDRNHADINNLIVLCVHHHALITRGLANLVDRKCVMMST